MHEPMDELFAIIKIAKTQQETVQVALEGLAKERFELAKEHKALMQLSVEIKQEAAKAVQAALSESLADTSEVSAKAIEKASQAAVARLSGVAWTAGEAERQLSGSIIAFGREWKWLAGCIGIGAVVASLMLGWGTIWLERGIIVDLQQQKATLQQEIQQLEAKAKGIK